MRNDISNANTNPAAEGEDASLFRSRDDRIAIGKALREGVARESHAGWNAPRDRRSPIEVLKESNRDRMPELVPIRYGRMMQSPFAFLRGSAGIMAADLASTPTTGVRVQACGDCHLLNFGLFATPERNLIFDLNDFDETLPAPWEWDLKRLAVSFVAAAREIGLTDKDAEAIAIECVRAYREQLRKFSKMCPLDVWYYKLDSRLLIDSAPDADIKDTRQKVVSKAKERISDYLYPKISEEVGGRRRIIDQPPLMFHVTQEQDSDQQDIIHDVLEQYRLSLPDERRILFDRYSLADVVVKAVGIGSVGTMCFVGLFFSSENHPLLLQFKQAGPSVLEPYVAKSCYENHGQRVVVGQRLCQSASDIFLGWTRSRRGRDFFVRQLRDMKMSASVTVDVSIRQAMLYATICGQTLAHSHAKSGDAATISGYMGKSDDFDCAIGDFATAYADQNEQDHAELVAAVASGEIEATVEEES
ncbi:hypothetical protein VN12_22650 [Pirellula sp. SH-Sr6A]|uniref:DUF2252 domain-containing protein n=1 Tax=Pirellula sp. SH-Sr6A TaxID=1632865 RepID=UPI00078C3E3F|nr:DUF2252 domain-containing protein [Pirellula sp. SH-Sr6A]AMV34944.1 hypothetical protein VN12_22650 [Pirellula sp. SH-Sr6A]